MYTVLVVDDSDMGRMILKRALPKSEYVVHEAAGGMQAIELLERHSIDIILLDLLMPDMSGQDVLRELRRREIASPVIVMTADIQASSRSECLSAGATAVLNKPVKQAELRQQIETVLKAEE